MADKNTVLGTKTLDNQSARRRFVDEVLTSPLVGDQVKRAVVEIYPLLGLDDEDVWLSDADDASRRLASMQAGTPTLVLTFPDQCDEDDDDELCHCNGDIDGHHICTHGGDRVSFDEMEEEPFSVGQFVEQVFDAARRGEVPESAFQVVALLHESIDASGRVDIADVVAAIARCERVSQRTHARDEFAGLSREDLIDFIHDLRADCDAASSRAGLGRLQRNGGAWAAEVMAAFPDDMSMRKTIAVLDELRDSDGTVHPVVEDDDGLNVPMGSEEFARRAITKRAELAPDDFNRCLAKLLHAGLVEVVTCRKR